MDSSNKIERSELWNKIFSVITQIPFPTKAVSDDAIDVPSATTIIENLIKNSQLKPEEKSEIMGSESINDIDSIGQEFIKWAEEYWLLDKLVKIENTDEFAGEKCDYFYMRNIFVDKINSIVKDRLGLK